MTYRYFFYVADIAHRNSWFTLLNMVIVHSYVNLPKAIDIDDRSDDLQRFIWGFPWLCNQLPEGKCPILGYASHHLKKYMLEISQIVGWSKELGHFPTPEKMDVGFLCGYLWFCSRFLICDEQTSIRAFLGQIQIVWRSTIFLKIYNLFDDLYTLFCNNAVIHLGNGESLVYSCISSWKY